jgi:DMSO/TMAO reductase YedYZ molybdopterin-dependent catalytic subunit
MGQTAPPWRARTGIAISAARDNQQGEATMPDDDDRMRQLETFGRVNNKLVETKKKWAREGRRLTGETATRQERRLPPGQDLVKSWPVLDLGVHPNVPAKDWTLQIGGKVVRPVSWGFDDLKAQPQAHSVSDIHCVTRWSRYDNNWDGVSLRQVMAAVEPLPEARFVLIKSYDGYTTNLPVAALEDDDVLLVHAWEGKPLTREHGGPVRLVVPKLYFWKSAKWIRSLWFSDTDAKGFWESRGYHNEGDPWQEQRYG